jgi:hypothetical protein
VRNNLKLVSGDFEVIKLADIISAEDRKITADFFANAQTIDRKLFYSNFDVGEAAISSYITRTRDKELALAADTNFITQVSINSLLVYLGVKRFLQDRAISKVILFNGRLDYVRAVLRACESLSVECHVFERARPGGYYEYFVNTLPHNIKAKKQLIEDAWNLSPLPLDEKIKIGSEFFNRKIRGEVTISKSYTSGQTKNALPSEIDFSKPTFVLYNSSDDEFVAVGEEYKNPFFEDQNAGIEYLVEQFGKRYPQFNLVIRMHPNLTGIDFSYATDIKAMHQRYKNVFVITPESVIDTYALLNKAWKVISFGSSMGMEATFWEKPVILLAKCRYFFSDVAYVPENIDQIDSLLVKELKPKEKLNAIVFGFYYTHGGTKAKYFESKSMTEQIFKGRTMNSYSVKQRVMSLLIRLLNRTLKTKFVGKSF